MRGSGPPSNTWFLGPTRVLNSNGISIGAVVLAGLTSVTDRPTDHATQSVTIGRIYVRSTAMRPINYDVIINNGPLTSVQRPHYLPPCRQPLFTRVQNDTRVHVPC